MRPGEIAATQGTPGAAPDPESQPWGSRVGAVCSGKEGHGGRVTPAVPLEQRDTGGPVFSVGQPAFCRDTPSTSQREQPALLKGPGRCAWLPDRRAPVGRAAAALLPARGQPAPCALTPRPGSRRPHQEAQPPLTLPPPPRPTRKTLSRRNSSVEPPSATAGGRPSGSTLTALHPPSGPLAPTRPRAAFPAEGTGRTVSLCPLALARPGPG